MVRTRSFSLAAGVTSLPTYLNEQYLSLGILRQEEMADFLQLSLHPINIVPVMTLLFDSHHGHLPKENVPLRTIHIQ